jgi:hypothetical protein
MIFLCAAEIAMMANEVLPCTGMTRMVTRKTR